jgi:serine/threonine-protein kinase RsbW
MAKAMNIGVRLKELRDLRGISLRKLAKKAGVSASFISQVEQSKCQPSLNTLRKISEALDVAISYLLEPEGNETSSPKEAIEIRLPNRLKYLSILADFIKNVCQKNEVPVKDVEDILLAVDEASTNIIKYAYEAGSPNYFRVRISCDLELVQVDLLDQGREFNPLEIPPPPTKGMIEEGGEKDLSLGIHIMKKVMDDIHYRYSPNEGNRLTLVKKISQVKGSGL